MKEAIIEKRKAFLFACRSDEERRTNIKGSRHASSVIAKTKANAWHGTCTSLFLLSLIPNQSILPSVPLQDLLLLSFLSLTFSSAPLQEKRHRSKPTTGNLTFLLHSQRLCVALPDASCLASCSKEYHSSFRSPPPNFFQLLIFFTFIISHDLCTSFLPFGSPYLLLPFTRRNTSQATCFLPAYLSQPM